MNARHVAALALVTWYLMVPPRDSCLGAFSGGTCPKVPLAKWEARWTYKTQSDCQSTLKDWQEKVAAYLAQDGTNNRSRTTRMWIDEMDNKINQQAQCVASDDPRLKAK
jgi:hypothetical protein